MTYNRSESNIIFVLQICPLSHGCVPTIKLFAWGEGDSGGHLLRETSRGLGGLVYPSRTSERWVCVCLLHYDCSTYYKAVREGGGVYYCSTYYKAVRVGGGG
jgi:hypothetical protein